MRVIFLAVAILLAGCSQVDDSAPTVITEREQLADVPADLTGTIDVTGAWWNEPTQFHLDGDDTPWRLDVDADGIMEYEGDGLPAEVEHVFDRVGARAAVLYAHGGQILAVTEYVIEGPEPLVEWAEMRLIAHSMKGITQHRDCVGLITGEPEMDCIVLSLDADGMHYLLGGGPNPWVTFLETCDVASASLEFNRGESLGGQVPEGAGCAVVWAYGADFGNIGIAVGPPGSDLKQYV